MKALDDTVGGVIVKYVSFNDAEKIKMFDVITKHFYEANFGQASKSDIELMMFNFLSKR